MRESFATRNMLVLLAILAGGIAVLAWWLLVSGYSRAPSVVVSGEKPAVKSEQRASVPAPEKPAPPAVAAATETLKGLADQLGPLKPGQSDTTPTFDVARIEPNGEAVIAGRTAPGASVELLQDGKVHDQTVADSSGAFVFVPKPLPPGSYNLTLRTTGPDGKATVSKGSVAVTLSAAKEQKPVAALAPPQAAPKAPPIVLAKPVVNTETRVQIDVVEAEGEGRLHVSGRSAPGATVRLYLNDAYIATATASPDGRVGFSIRSGVKAGEYRIRLDHVDPSGNVLSRIETPFSAPVTVAETKPSVPVETAQGRLDTSASSAVSPEKPSQQASVAEKKPSPSTISPSVSANVAAAPPASEQSGQQLATSQRESASAPAIQTSPRLPAASETAAQPRPTPDAKPSMAAGPMDQRGVVVVPSINTKVVVRGDNLWRISQATYGHGKRYTVIFSANRKLIRNPNLIYPDQIFVLPNALPQ